MVLKMHAVEKSYPGAEGPVPVLRGVSLGLEPGQSLALTGESGSGKSTLLHLAGGLDHADSGRVEVAGQELTGLDDRGRAALRRGTIGVVFQQFNLIPSLSVAANIGFQARLAARFDPAEVNRLADAMGLGAQMDKYPEALSGGQQQRVAIARALAARPRLVLADEPTGNLDEATADGVLDLLLEQVSGTGAALMIVTHSERLAARADRRLHLSHGRLA